MREGQQIDHQPAGGAFGELLEQPVEGLSIGVAREQLGTVDQSEKCQGWLHLAVVIDLFNRQVVGFAMGERMTRTLVMDALRMAWFRRHPALGLIFHSGQIAGNWGSQYASNDYRQLLRDFKMISSMSRKGDCWDNAVTETLFGSLKVERLHGMRFGTRRQAKDEVIDWIAFYNHRRLHSTLGYASPMAFEQKWLARQISLAA